MVEITQTMSNLRRILTICLIALPAAGWLFAQQPHARIEANPEYQSLLEQDRALQAQQDSVAHAIEELRSRLRSHPEERNTLSDKILELEMQTFEIRSAKGKIVNRINELEQEWVLAQLEGADAAGGWMDDPAPEKPLLMRGPRVRNLIYNSYFHDHLPAADYAALCEAQQLEPQAAGLADRYFATYDTIARLARQYETVTEEAEAFALYDRIDSLQGVNQEIADSLEQAWNYIFDNKSYAYDYLLDKLNQEKLLGAQESRIAAAMQQMAELRGETASDQVADYFLRRQASVAYEAEVAKLLELEAACDSLAQVSKQLQAADFRRPKIRVIERYFIDYEEVTFPGAAKYTAQHPIPACKIYERGTIYRIQLGRFSAKRPVSTFKGAYPLCYQIDEEKKWVYYAGGFATRAEAEAAQKQLKEKGFQRPEIVVWTNGEQHNLSQEGDAHATVYRVEILNAPVLSAEIRTAITAVAEEAEISKVGQQLFIVGHFSDRATAESVAEAIREADGQLEIKVAEMVE